MTRFLHTADWQLGMTRHFLSGDAQARYSAARREAVAGLGALAAETGAEFVVVAGDVFEYNHLDPRVVSTSLEAMRAIGVPVYLLPGNHDQLDASSVYTSELFRDECPPNVTVLDRSGVFEVRPGLQIVAAPWRIKHPTEDLTASALEGLEPRRTTRFDAGGPGFPSAPPALRELRATSAEPRRTTRFDAGGPGFPSAPPVLRELRATSAEPRRTTRILVAHGGVDILDPDPTKASLIRLGRLERALSDGLISYVALGDKHSRTCVGDTGRIWYSGSPEVTNYDDIEPDPGHVLIVDIDDAAPERGVTVESRRVGRWRFLTLDCRLDDDRDIADLAMNLDELPDKERTVVRLVLTGTLTVTDRAKLDALLDRCVRLFGGLGRWESHCDLAVVPADGEFAELGFAGFAATAVDELVATARSADTDDAQAAQGALALLLRLAGRGVAQVPA